jgi:hypothetical protein
MNEGSGGGSGDKTQTYTTEVHSQSSLQGSFPPWQILPLLNTLRQGLTDLFERWSTVHGPRPQKGQWAIYQLPSVSKYMSESGDK